MGDGEPAPAHDVERALHMREREEVRLRVDTRGGRARRLDPEVHLEQVPAGERLVVALDAQALFVCLRGSAFGDPGFFCFFAIVISSLLVQTPHTPEHSS